MGGEQQFIQSLRSAGTLAIQACENQELPMFYTVFMF